MSKKLWLTGLVAFALALPIGIIGANAASKTDHGTSFVGNGKSESVDAPSDLVPDPTFPDDKTPVMTPGAAEQQKRAVIEAEKRGSSDGYSILPSHIDQYFIDAECGPEGSPLGKEGADALDCESFKLINDERLRPGSYATREDLQTAVDRAEER